MLKLLLLLLLIVTVTIYERLSYIATIAYRIWAAIGKFTICEIKEEEQINGSLY